MLAYPQLETGALSQFPIQKTRKARTVLNEAADGTTIKLADSAGGSTEWVLTYVDLADDELAVLLTFFASAEGTLNSFTFLDPASNLLAWSETLNNAAWQKDPFLTMTNNIADPKGGTSAWQLTNGGGASQGLTQTLAAPGGYQYCMSAYVQATTPTTVNLIIGNQTAQRYAGTTWNRIVFPATGDPQATSVSFGIAVAAGPSVQVYGLQVEPQNGASGYKATTLGGVYANAHLGADALASTATDLNRHSCKVKIVNVNHL